MIIDKDRNSSGMERSPRFRPAVRAAVFALFLAAPLVYLFALHGGPIAQPASYHQFADDRTLFGVRNFSNVASSLLFLLPGAAGVRWCLRHRARVSWLAFFAGVALVAFGSAYYHLAPDDDRLAWDRLAMAIAFMGLFTALVCEHLGAKHERLLLALGLALGIAAVLWWQASGDLRFYLWVQAAPLLAVPYLLAASPGRYTHRHYLLAGAALYAVAKLAEYYDREIFALTSHVLSGHSLKHVFAALAPLCVHLMLERRSEIAT
jgi:hypothetical protein